MLRQAKTGIAWSGRPLGTPSAPRAHPALRTTAVAALGALFALSQPVPAAGALSATPDPGYVTNGEVKAIAHAGSITYIGGAFTEVGPATGPGVALNSEGAESGGDKGWARIWGGVGSVSAVVSDGSGGYYVGGSFTEVAGHAAENLAHIKSNGEVDTAWLPKANNTVNALAVSGEVVYVGGAFTTIGTNNASRSRIAALKASGAVGAGEATSWNPKANNTVNALAVAGTSVVYAGGTFTKIGSTSLTRRRLAAIKTNAEATATAEATSWTPNAINGEVNALAVSGTSVVYVGGSFTEIGSTTEVRNRLAAIKTNAEATATAEATSWNPNANNTVNALAASGPSVVYAGGTFTEIGSTQVPRSRLAAIKTNAEATATAEATSWTPNAINGEVNALALSGTSVVYVGGSFTEIGSTTEVRHRLAAIKTNAAATETAEATSWNPNAINGEVNALAVSGSVVYAGGTFQSVGLSSQVRNRLAALNSGNDPTSWNPNASNTVDALAVSGEVVYVGGAFTTIGTNNASRSRIAALKASGAVGAGEATSWNPKANNTVNALAVAGTSVVYAGGTFTKIGSTVMTRNRLAAIKTNAAATETAEATSWNPSANNTVNALALSGTSVVYVGGSFTEIGSTVVTRNRLAAIKTNAAATETAEATSWNPSATNTVNALALSGTSVVYVGGSFTEIGSTVVTRNRLAAIKTNAAATETAEATSWNPSANNTVNALVVSGEAVYVGGSFTEIGTNSAARNRLAAIKTNAEATETAEATSWNPSANNTVNAVATSASGSKLYVGGVFTTLGTGNRAFYASFTIGGPTAAFSVSSGPYTAGLTTVTFTNESTDQTGSITTYAWTFGDTGTATSASPTHTYSAPCSPCTVTLKVTDSEGLSAEVSTAITVAEGTLTFFTTSPSLPALPGLTLNGEAQTTTTTMNNFTVDYAKSGGGEGWDVTVSGHEEAGLSPVFKQYCPEAACGGVGYVGGGFSLPANSLTLNSTGASFTALPGGTGGAPEVRCESGECAIDAAQSSPVKVVSAAVGNGKGGWQTSGFSGTSLSLATPKNLHALPEHEAYRVDVIWTLNSGP